VVYYITNYVAKDDMTEKHCNEMMRLAMQKVRVGARACTRP
jgi:hypothetical protein